MPGRRDRANLIEGVNGSGGQANDRLARGRLLVALDALLATRSVTEAARRLGMQPSGVSRTLAELRILFDDPLLIRSGRGFVPSPKAEALRPRIQSLVASIHALFDDVEEEPVEAERFDTRWNVPYEADLPPLANRPFPPLPGPHEGWRSKGAEATPAPMSEPMQQLAQAIGLVGSNGKRLGLGLEPPEAAAAMEIILRGDADPVQIGAFLSLVQMRGTTASELAGFVRAARGPVATCFRGPRGLAADLDWPCYLSPRNQQPPWFFHAAKLVARAGYRVVLHGSSGPFSGRHGVAASVLDIPTCADGAQAAAALATHGIAYVPLAELSPQIFRLLGLYALTNNRSPVNELVQLLRPVEATASLLGVTKPSYRDIHRDAAAILGLRNLSIVGNTKDVAQFNPFRGTTIHRLSDGVAADDFVPSLPEIASPDRTAVTSLEHWSDVWTGNARNPRAEQIIIATAAAALLTLSRDSKATFETAREDAARLWAGRHAGVAAPRRSRR